ncbi:unnamed protein product [Schistocephalus solidus]|uniref:Reverse transcriptase domain-containing protein n=1 Tax=Schistocephalus solidus TaxID=70667 RepID=A0A183SIR6_SCHSO|nr:unnamed protein product [Schistocephalus solidus]
MPQAEIEPATTNAMATLANHSTTSSWRGALSQINMHAIDNTAICGGCQKPSMKLNQIKDEIRQIKSALKGTSKAVDATQESTERLNGSKTIDTRSKGIPITVSRAATAIEKQVPTAQDKKNRLKRKTYTKEEKSKWTTYFDRFLKKARTQGFDHCLVHHRNN